ncbi:replication initiator [Actinoplanes sp. N902-109]|uniref:replication initiator n=1 Tax=Actinoplanes sp. (strain N902-109) TaxID=649831 RepID=UPI0012F7A4B2
MATSARSHLLPGSVRGTGHGITSHDTPSGSRALPSYAAAGQALSRATTPDYFGWLEHVRPAAGCTRPIRLSGTLNTIEHGTGRLLNSIHTDTMPDAVIYRACGNRRQSGCPSCAATYQADAFQLLRAGIDGGKGIPATVATHPAVFATFTAPSFGAVHTRHVKHHTCTDRRRCDCRPQPCHARRRTGLCTHGNAAVCWTRHDTGDPQLGQPLCLDCYDYHHHVVWNLFTGKLWHRTKQNAERFLARLCQQRGIERVPVTSPTTGRVRMVAPVRLSHGKAAEMQRRGAVHFHALIRLDGIDPDDHTAIVPPPTGITVDDLTDAIRHAATVTQEHSPAHPDRPDGWPIVWGDPDRGLDIRPLALSGNGEITDDQAAAYLAKYATKSTEATGYQSTRINSDSDEPINPDGGHIARLVAACWRLGRPIHTPVQCQPSLDTPPAGHPETVTYQRLRRWAHMLGFGGHFLTKARRYSTTFATLRTARADYRRTTHPDHTPTPLDTTDGQAVTVGALTFAGVGWHTTGDALLANTAAALARQRHRTGREELAHETGTDLSAALSHAA